MLIFISVLFAIAISVLVLWLMGKVTLWLSAHFGDCLKAALIVVLIILFLGPLLILIDLFCF